MKLVLQIALGIILATIVLWVGTLGVTTGVAWWATQQLEKQVEEQQERQAERKGVVAEALRLEEEKNRIAAIRAQQAREARQAREREQNRLERAFEDQYQPPPGCTSPNSNTRWVECVDLKRAAKAAFMGRQEMLEGAREDIQTGR